MNRRIVTAVAALSLTASVALASSRPLHSTSLHYRDRGIAVAHGRSGSASIAAQALLGRDGLTTVTVSTDAPGSLGKVRLAAGAGSPARNFNGLSGAAFTEAVGGLTRRQPLQVTAHVSGIDGARTDVVDAVATVGLRPDLAVEALDAPERAKQGVPVVIEATVRERNGDTGATANCILTVDGVEADRADGVWVDAGDAVDCRFSAVFDSAGVKQLAVQLAGIAPADDDPSNDAASATVDVTATFDGYVARATEKTSRYHWIASTGDRYYENQTDVDWSQRSSISAFAAVPLNPETMSIRIRETTDDGEVDDSGSIPLDRVSFASAGESTTCVTGFANNRSVQACMTTHANGSVTLNAFSSRTASSVTYASYGWDRRFTDTEGTGWMWNYDETEVRGTPHPYGTMVWLDLILTDGATTFQATPAMPMQRTTRRREVPRFCSTYGSETSCYESETVDETLLGTAAGDHSY